jgi:glutamyl-tRNA reductase
MMAMWSGEKGNEVPALALVSMSYRTAPLSVLEDLRLDAADCEKISHELRANEGIDEVVVLSTCNRTEFYISGCAPDPKDVLLLLRRLSMMWESSFASIKTGEAVLHHLLRVAVGLESRVVGEAEVLAQIRAAAAAAIQNGFVGPATGAAFRCAAAAGRRAQRSSAKTDIPSLARLALDAAHPDPDVTPGSTVVLGSGTMAATTVRELIARDLPFVVCARRIEKARLLTQTAEQAIPFSNLTAALAEAAVVVCATGARSPLVRERDLTDALQVGRTRSLTIIDLSMPRNIEPTVGELRGVRLLNLTDLEADTTTVEIDRREQIVADELQRHRDGRAGKAAGHYIVQLRRHVHQECLLAARTARSGMVVDDDAIRQSAKQYANQLLHAPTLALKELIADENHKDAIEILNAFGVDPSLSDSRLPMTTMAKANL